jgi:isopenicillin N synthase-like dioxygenase
MTDTLKVPAIDIAPFLDGSDKAGVARAFAKACEEIGFVVVSGHGIPLDVIEGLIDR